VVGRSTNQPFLCLSRCCWRNISLKCFGFERLTQARVLSCSDRATDRVGKISSVDDQNGKLNYPRVPSAWRLLLTITFTIFVVELLIMLYLHQLLEQSTLFSVIDAAVLTIVIFPAMYYWFYEPFVLEINQRQWAETELRQAYVNLEAQVEGRTVELERVNEQLRAEIDERRSTEEELRESERSLSEAQRIAHLGSWSYDVQEDVITASDETRRIFGLPVGSLITWGKYLEFVHPDDRARHDQDWEAALRGAPIDIEYRIVVDGELKWMEDRAEVEFDRDGQPLNAIGTIQDITERKRAEERRQEFEAALHQKDLDIRKAYADVFSAVTGEKLLLLTPEEISAAQGESISRPYRVSSFEDLAGSRDFIRSALEPRGLAKDDLNSLILASGEVITNGVKHAGSCEVQVYSIDETIQLRISDHGQGIDFSDLPKATLLPGFSTKKSLGMGFAVVLKICDRVLLSTGPHGTTLLLETGGKKEEDSIDDILARGLLNEEAV